MSDKKCAENDTACIMGFMTMDSIYSITDSYLKFDYVDNIKTHLDIYTLLHARDCGLFLPSIPLSFSPGDMAMSKVDLCMCGFQINTAFW